MTPTPRQIRLTLDRLEDRSLPATGVTTTLANGVLRVTGTESNDVIIMRQTGANQVTVSTDGKAARVYNGVREISVDARGGNDYVSFDTKALGANEGRLALKATLVGGTGNDVLIGGAGNDSIYGGAGNDSLFGNGGNDLIYGGDGNDLINGGAGDDTIFGEAGDDTIYGSAGQDTMSGGSGNDYLDGGAGVDTLNGGTGFDTFHNIFPVADILNQSDPEDVRQGLSGTCVCLASLQAISGTGVDMAGRIKHLNANHYAVPIFRPGTGWVDQVVYFDGTWTDNDPSPTFDGAAWALLYQRAYLQEMGVNWADPDSGHWANKYGGDFQNIDQAFATFTGKSQYIGSRPGGLTDGDKAILQQAFNSKHPLIALSRPYGSTVQADMNRLGIITSHTYSVIGFGSRNGQMTVKLRNPWGTDGPVKYGADDGIIEILWTDFRRVMLGFCIA